MVMTFRDEKGSNLTADEVDENFRTLQAAIEEFEPPPGVGIVSFSIVGTMLYVNLSNSTQAGPYPLPTVSYTWREEWAPDTVYAVYDFFSVAGDGVYLVLQPYTSPADDTSGPAIFDPEVSNTDGPLLQKMFGTPSTGPLLITSITPDTDGNVFLNSDIFGQYVRIDSADPVTINILPSGDSGIVAGQLTTFRQVGTGQLTFTGNTDTIINTPESVKSRKQGSTVTILYVGGEEYDLAGDLELI